MIYQTLAVVYILGVLLLFVVLSAAYRQRPPVNRQAALAHSFALVFACLLWPGFVLNVVIRNVFKKRAVK